MPLLILKSFIEKIKPKKVIFFIVKLDKSGFLIINIYIQEGKIQLVDQGLMMFLNLFDLFKRVF